MLSPPENGQPIQRNAANARERARMRVLSSAFCRLKTKLPWVPADTKLSKLDTLRLAKGYIQQLEAILAGQPIDDNLQIATGQHHNLVSGLMDCVGDQRIIGNIIVKICNPIWH